MESWKIVTLVGAVVFLVSAFLPLLSIGSFGFSIGFSLADFYGVIGSALGQSGFSLGGFDLPAGATLATIELILTLVLFPIAVILGFLSYLRRKLSLVAGILGIICWVGAILFVASIQSLIGAELGGMLEFSLGYGAGIFVGIAGAIILMVASFLKIGGAPQQAAMQPFPPPPPPPQ